MNKIKRKAKSSEGITFTPLFLALLAGERDETLAIVEDFKKEFYVAPRGVIGPEQTAKLQELGAGLWPEGEEESHSDDQIILRFNVRFIDGPALRRSLNKLTPVLSCSSREDTGVAQVVMNDLQLQVVPEPTPRT